MLKKTLAFALVGGAFRVLARRLRRKFNRQRKGKRCRFPGKNRTGSRCARGAQALPPITADKVADGTYPITVDSSSNMFRIVDAQLIVENGSMHCVMTLSGTGYGKLFMGTGDEAAAASEADFIPYVENAEGKYTYDVPVDALDEDTACAAWSIRKEQWYDRTLVFESAGVDLRADALK